MGLRKNLKVKMPSGYLPAFCVLAIIKGLTLGSAEYFLGREGGFLRAKSSVTQLKDLKIEIC